MLPCVQLVRVGVVFVMGSARLSAKVACVGVHTTVAM